MTSPYPGNHNRRNDTTEDGAEFGTSWENNPSTHDCPSPDHNADAQCFNVDYRYRARSIDCDEPMNSSGSKHNCIERGFSYLEPVRNYVSFFAGLRRRSRLLGSGSWTLPAIDKGGKLEIAQGGGGTTTPFLSRAPGTGAAWVSQQGGPGQRFLSSDYRRAADYRLFLPALAGVGALVAG